MDARLELDLSEIDRLLQLARMIQEREVLNDPDIVANAIRDLAKAVNLLAKMIEWQILKGMQ